MKLRSAAETDAAMKNFLETFDYIDPETGEPYRPAELPPDPDPDPDDEEAGH